jgi:TPR repeat protein
MVTCNGAHEKQEHALSFTFQSVPDNPDLNEIRRRSDQRDASAIDSPVLSHESADMNAALKTVVNDGRPSRTRLVVLWSVVFAVVCGMVGLFLLALLDVGQPVVAQQDDASMPRPHEAAGETCLRLSENPRDYISSEAMQWRTETRLASCKPAFAAEPDNAHLKVAVARAMPIEQRAESVALLHEAAAQNDAEAWYEIYESHKSWDRGDLDKVPVVPRAEADRALHRAAELGHPFATQMLAVLLDRGTTVKRDPAAARYWAERAVANPAKGESRGDLQVLLARLLVTSDKPEERARGIDLLERLSGRFGAKTALANAIRGEDPVRARALLEEALRPDPGSATPALAEMLIKGEGGPADPKRALKMLTQGKNMAAAAGVLGQLYLDGKLVPRDVQEAVRLIGMAGQWDLEARQQVIRLLAENPDVREQNPKRVLYFAVEAAELDEPGAMAALISLKLSENPQFRDRPGACKLIETAAKRGDQSAARRLPECRTN